MTSATSPFRPNRRTVVCGVAASLLPLPALAEIVMTPAQVAGGDDVVRLARDAARRPFSPPDIWLPADVASIDYDAYRAIRYRKEHALWRGGGLGFEIEFFQRASIQKDRVEVYELQEGVARAIRYAPDLFDFGATTKPGPHDDLGFAGFRIHAPFNRPDYLDEFCVFLGASYFRAVAKGEVYGLSARGVCIGTGGLNEEFPAFRSFWLERPAPGAASLVVHALLDGPSLTGAYRIVATPGDEAVFDIEATLFPRQRLAEIGLAPNTSMYDFGPNERTGIDDFRPAVHDSDGLAIAFSSSGSWRPLVNPHAVQSSLFNVPRPAGFGLIQRDRSFASYEDLEARYESRPSLWAEPLKGFDDGNIVLVEIPTKTEFNDNAVAFWQPAEALEVGTRHEYAYRLRWGAVDAPHPLPRCLQTLVGAGPNGSRKFVLDLETVADQVQRVRGAVSADTGSVANVTVTPNTITGGVRLAFEFDPKGALSADLDALLIVGDKPASEKWLYRWIA